MIGRYQEIWPPPEFRLALGAYRAVTVHTSVASSARRRPKQTLPVFFSIPMPALVSRLGPVPVVNPAALDQFLNPVGTADDAMNEGRSSGEGAEAGGPNGCINS